jgi:signal peptidase I
MVPSIAVGERLALGHGEPGRGRVIVFRWVDKPDHEYVKRVVGIAGDTISANGTEIVLNGTPIPRCRVGTWTFDGHAGELWLEALDGVTWLVYHDASKTVAERGPWTVASGEVFVLGDNRENVTDSRKWFGGKGGGLPLHLIVGIASDARPRLPKDAEQLQTAFDSCIATLRDSTAASSSSIEPARLPELADDLLHERVLVARGVGENHEKDALLGERDVSGQEPALAPGMSDAEKAVGVLALDEPGPADVGRILGGPGRERLDRP